MHLPAGGQLVRIVSNDGELRTWDIKRRQLVSEEPLASATDMPEPALRWETCPQAWPASRRVEAPSA